MGREAVDTVWHWFHGRPQGPLAILLNPTMACNLNCLFCRRQDELPAYYRSKKELSDERYVQIAEELAQMDLQSFGVKGGGEPLIRRRLLVRLIPIIKRNGNTETRLITNATLLDDETAESFVRWEWGQITISLDGPDAATHDALRAKAGVFDRVLAALERLNRFKRTYGKAKPSLQFHVVLTNRVHQSLDRIISLAKAYDVASVELDSLATGKPSSNGLALSEGDIRAFQERLPEYVALAENSQISHNFRSFQRREAVIRSDCKKEEFLTAAGSLPGNSYFDRIPCFMPWYFVSITPEGALSPCCYGESEPSAPTLHTVSFREAWYGAAMDDFRKSMLDGSMKSFCKNCTSFYIQMNAETRRQMRSYADKIPAAAI